MSRFLSFMTAVAVGSVAVGTAALIIALTILDGFERDLRENLIGFSSHIQLRVFRGEAVDESTDMARRLRALPNIAAASPYLEREAMAVTRNDIDGIRVKGIDSTSDISRLKDKIVDGRYELRPIGGKHSVIVGKRLADKLHLSVGDRVVLLGVTDLESVYRAPKVQCVIRGLYETGMAEYLDDIYVFTALETSRKVFALPGLVSGYDVLCRDAEAIDESVDAIQEQIGYPWDPRSVFSIYRNLFVWVDLQQELVPLVVGSLILISAFNIIATLLLFVIEKTQNIGILLALGAGRGSIKRIFVMQGLVIGVAGSVIGSLIAFAFCYSQQELQFFSLPQDVYFMTTVPIHLSIEVFAGISFVAVALTFFSSLIPAWLAARLNPITSIRFH